MGANRHYGSPKPAAPRRGQAPHRHASNTSFAPPRSTPTGSEPGPGVGNSGTRGFDGMKFAKYDAQTLDPEASIAIVNGDAGPKTSSPRGSAGIKQTHPPLHPPRGRASKAAMTSFDTPPTTSPDRALLDPNESFHSRKVDLEEVNDQPSNATKSKMS